MGKLRMRGNRMGPAHGPLYTQVPGQDGCVPSEYRGCSVPEYPLKKTLAAPEAALHNPNSLHFQLFLTTFFKKKKLFIQTSVGHLLDIWRCARKLRFMVSKIYTCCHGLGTLETELSN